MRSAALRGLVRRIGLIGFDFDGVFTDNRVLVFEDGREAVLCSRADGLGLAKLGRLGVAGIIISTETNPVVSRRAAKLCLPCRQGVSDKLAELRRVARRAGLGLERVAFVGNDVNDADCLRAVGLPIVVADARPEVRPLARYVTRAPGGLGAVREICDMFEALKS